MLDRLRRRLDLLSPRHDRQDIQAQRDRVVCEYLAEYRRLCREVGPIRYALDLGLGEPGQGGSLPWPVRTVAYAAAWRDMEASCDFIDEAIDAATAGFEDWQAQQETAAK